MNGAYQGCRILKKHDTGIVYVAIPDLIQDFETRRNESSTTAEEDIYQALIESYRGMIMESVDHDL